jgi:PIN domain nuclease of toxin-antitoxin system
MKALLDTHVFLWWNMEEAQLSESARRFITDGANELFFSAASAWEIALKYARGRLVLPEPPDQYVPSRMALHRFQPLPVQISHAVQVHRLPEIHSDPFDRLIIAQSQLEGLPILTADAAISRYEVEVIW